MTPGPCVYCYYLSSLLPQGFRIIVTRVAPHFVPDLPRSLLVGNPEVGEGQGTEGAAHVTSVPGNGTCQLYFRVPGAGGRASVICTFWFAPSDNKVLRRSLPTGKSGS